MGSPHTNSTTETNANPIKFNSIVCVKDKSRKTYDFMVKFMMTLFSKQPLANPVDLLNIMLYKLIGPEYSFACVWSP